MKKVLLFSPVLSILMMSVFSSVGNAQTNVLGGWHIGTLFYQPAEKIVVYGEAQVRSQDITNNFSYHELKAGIGYYFQKRNYVLFGLGDYETYPFPGNFKTPALVKEFRMWEQLVVNNNINTVKIEHRYRIEQRWLNGVYRNRFRYRINPTVPINHSTVTSHTLYVTAFDEVFFTSRAPYFERNRLFIGFGYQFTPLFAFQLGGIRQFDYRISDGGKGKNFIQSSFVFTSFYQQQKKNKGVAAN